MNGATCNEDINKYTCTCVPGYNGLHCEEGGWEFQKCLLSTGVSYGQVYSKTVFTVVLFFKYIFKPFVLMLDTISKKCMELNGLSYTKGIGGLC